MMIHSLKTKTLVAFIASCMTLLTSSDMSAMKPNPSTQEQLQEIGVETTINLVAQMEESHQIDSIVRQFKWQQAMQNGSLQLTEDDQTINNWLLQHQATLPQHARLYQIDFFLEETADFPNGALHLLPSHQQMEPIIDFLLNHQGSIVKIVHHNTPQEMKSLSDQLSYLKYGNREIVSNGLAKISILFCNAPIWGPYTTINHFSTGKPDLFAILQAIESITGTHSAFSLQAYLKSEMRRANESF